MRKKGLIGKSLKKIPSKPKAKKPTQNLGPNFGVKTHQLPEHAPRKV